LDGAGRRLEAIPFLEDLVKENPSRAFSGASWLKQYRHAKRIPEAVAQLDAVGEALLNAGEKESAISVIESIIAMTRPIKPGTSSCLKS